MYDISMLSKDQVLALINQSAGLSLTWDQVTFGEPVAATGTSPTRNTELIINGIPNSGYKGSTTIFYDRIDLAEFAALESHTILQIEGAVTIDKIVAAFNALYGSNLQLDDVRDDHVMPTDISAGVLFTLRAAAGSFAYRNSIDMTLQPADIDLDTAIVDPMLNGLTLNQPTEGTTTTTA